MKKLYIFIISGLLLGLSVNLRGQDTTEVVGIDTTQSTLIDSTLQDSTGFLKTDNVEVIKAFEAKLADAIMLSINPKLTEIIPVIKKYNYDVTIVPYAIEYPAPIIRPVAMRRDDPPKVFKHFLKAGYGNIKNATGDLRLSHIFSDVMDWNLGLKYRSLDNNNDIPFQKFSSISGNTGLGLTVLETSRLEFNVGGGLEQRNFFYNESDRSDALTSDDVKRDIGRISGGVQFYNAVDNSTLVDYRIGLNGYYTTLSDIDEKEFNGIANVELTKRREDGISVSFTGGVDFNSSFGKNDLIGFADPYIRIAKSQVTVDIGLDYIFANEKSYVFPKGELNFAIDQKAVQVYVGVDQIYHRNNMRNTVAYNPFSNGFNGVATAITRDFYAGAKGDILGLVYRAKVGYKDIQNQAFFNTIFQDSLRRFAVNTTDLKSYYVSGSIEVPIRDILTVGGSVTQNFFEDVGSGTLWHIPQLDLSLYGVISLLHDKVSIRSDIFIRDGVEAETPNGIESLDDLFDLNLEATLMPVENIGIYLAGKNLLDRAYRRWYGYPNVGLHLEAGIKAKF
ncbi:MAG: hypothetical protein HKN68_10455 [Saprospiraceae bacterium]|nr:hypothetical protein [Saprospiraceae bacterium]